MTGKQCQKLPPRLNQDFLHITGVDDPNFTDPVGQRFPEIRYGYPVSYMELIQVAKIAGPAVAPVARNDAVGIHAADGQARLAQVGGSVCHVLFRGSQVDGHFQVDGWNAQDPEDFIREAVVRKTEAGFLVVIGAG